MRRAISDQPWTFDPPSRALKNLDSVADYLEDAGLTAQSDNVDGAADRIQDVLDTLESL